MHFLSIIWNPNETLFNIGFVQIKYYNLSWIIAFALGWYIMKKIFIHEKKSVEQLDSLFIHTVLGTMLGARLGHVFFYDWPYYKKHLLEILLPIRESSTGSLFFGLIDGYEFTGFTGLASHGAIIGVIIGIYVYTRKFPEFKLLWILDRMVVPFGMIAFVRFGNFFNSEINGKVVDESFIFATKFIRDSDDLHPSKALAVTKEKTLNAAYDAIENNPEFSQYLAEIPYRHPAQLYEGVA
ncbi:MAG: prolipoprotein diacylglyceryl transferase family protein, partial [Maribacter sp.]